MLNDEGLESQFIATQLDLWPHMQISGLVYGPDVEGGSVWSVLKEDMAQLFMWNFWIS